MRPPDTRRRSGTGTPSATQTVDQAGRPPKRTGPLRPDAATRWLAEELAAVIETLAAARLTAKAGHVPFGRRRPNAVRLVALDATVAEQAKERMVQAPGEPQGTKLVSSSNLEEQTKPHERTMAPEAEQATP